MKSFMILMCVTILACNPPKHKYYILIASDEEDLIPGQPSHLEIKRDSIMSQYDSIAYKEGFFKYGGMLMAEKLLKDKNLQVSSHAKGFQVVVKKGSI